MKTITARERENLFTPPLKAVIIYDDVGYAARAAAGLERAAGGADTALKCDVKLWRLDALRQPTPAIITLAVAADANLIVFALNEAQPPPEELLKWLEHWAANRRVEDAAVTLLGPDGNAATPLRRELERFARRHRLAFLDAQEAWDDGASAAGAGAPPPEAPPDERDFLPEVEPLPAVSHWGIND